MRNEKHLNLSHGAVIALPFYENEKFVIAAQKGGGMGNVYQLIPLSPIRRILALKTYKDISSSEEFSREAKIWISLGTHDNIAEAITFDKIDGMDCILSCWYESSLVDIKPKSLQLSAIHNIVYGIINGLMHAQKVLNLVHKDVKPQNILVDEKLTAKIADFGISSCSKRSIMNIDKSTHLSKNTTRIDVVGGVCGTPFYMAPELFEGAVGSVQTDIFSLGVSIYEWLMGHHPYLNSDGYIDMEYRPNIIKDIKSIYGEKFHQLAHLIDLAVIVNKDNRPSGYMDLLDEANFINNKPEQNRAKSGKHIDDLVAKARLLREQGNFDEAKAILESNMGLLYSDPLLLNAYASLMKRQKNFKDAYMYYYKAIEVLRKNCGLYNGIPYTDPYLNYFYYLYEGKHYIEAEKLIVEANSILSNKLPEFKCNFIEFAWGKLYQGEFDESANMSLKFLRTKSSTDMALSIFCLSAYLSGNLKRYADSFYDLIVAQSQTNMVDMQYICLLSGFVDGSRLRKLKADVLNPSIVSELKKMGEKLCGDTTLFSIPMTQVNISGVMRGIELELTGGKYNEHI